MSEDLRAARRLTLALAALAGGASVALSGVAGWFLASAAIVGAAGPLAAHAFNFLAPSAGVRFFAMLRTLSRYGERVVGHDAVLAESARLRPRLFLALAQREARKQSLSALGDIDARVMRDVEAVEADLVQIRAPAAAAFGGLVAAALALMFAGAGEALIVAAAFAAAFWGAPTLAVALTGKAGEALVAQRARLRALSAAFEKGGAEVKTLGAGPAVVAMFDNLGADIAANEVAIARASALISGLTGVVWTVALCAMIAIAAAHDADPAALAAAVLASLALSEQAAAQTEIGARQREREAAQARVEAMLDDGAILERTAAQRPWEIKVKDFAALSEAGGPVRRGVTFAVGPGEVVILTGQSGAGKSTLLRALLGQLVSHAGDVSIGGVRPHERRDLAALIAYASQSVELLPGTVRENLELGAPNADDGRMWGALREAGLDEVIARAGGLDAEISALGEGFSGGEARRLALARAFISERPLLLLDEPSEGLDAEAEARIASAIRDYVNARPGRLAVVVTHRAALRGIGDTCVDLDAGGTASVH